MLRLSVSVAIIWLVGGGATRTSAHDLPISYMTIVAAEDTVHVELVLNAAELVFFPEIDLDHNGIADPEEVKTQSDKISRAIINCFTFQIDGQPVAAAVQGVVSDLGTHHWTIRAHYPGDARKASVHLVSHLAAITNRSHVIEVTFQRPQSRQAARLDAHDREVVFDFERPPGVAAVRSKRPGTGLYRRSDCTLVVGLAFLLGSFYFYRWQRKYNSSRNGR